MLAAGAALLAAAALAGGKGSSVREGGQFRIAFAQFDETIDPVFGADWFLQLQEATCALLMNHPDKPPPAGLRLVPDAAAAPPRVSADGKKYTFTIRRGLRFSNGTRLSPGSFARAFARALAPSLESAGAIYLEDVIGAQDTPEGGLPAGIVVKGNRLTIRLRRRVPDFPARMTMPYFCAVPPNLPIDPEGVSAPLPSAGPYYFGEFVRGRRVVLRRNRFYRGKRPHHVDSFVAELAPIRGQGVIDTIKAGRADWGFDYEQAYFQRARELTRLRSQFSARPGLLLFGFALNSRRPLFGDVRLRRAVNFAIDRRALVRQWGGPQSGRPTDQYLPPVLPGFRDASIYPLRRPNLRRAKALARGRLHGRKASLYVRDDPLHVALAQIVKRNLAAIGLGVDLKVFPRSVYFQKLNTPGERWDITPVTWFPAYTDPFTYLNELFSSRSTVGFASKKYDRLLARVARLGGRARERAYGALDVRLARDAAPMAAAFVVRIPTFVSKRVDPRCVVLRPYLDLAAVCLKR